MFDKAKQSPTTEKRAAAVRLEVQDMAKKRELFLTHILMEEEPYRSMAFHAMDGKVLEGTFVQPHGEPMDLPNVRLVCIDSNPGKQQRIRHKQWSEERIPGTIDRMREGWKIVDDGIDATLSNKLARYVLRQQGWPVCDQNSNGGRNGSVVEWEWLKWEAQRAGCPESVREVYERLASRIEPKDKKDTKNAPAQPRA